MGALAPEEAFRIQPTEHCDGFLQGARLLRFICHFGSSGSKIAIAFFSLALVTAAQSADPATALALERAGKLPEAVEEWRAARKPTPREAPALGRHVFLPCCPPHHTPCPHADRPSRRPTPKHPR